LPTEFTGYSIVRHRLELSFNGRRTVASLDEAPLVSIEDSAHSHGMFAPGTEWDRIQFDNLQATQ
jgi:hypothetical protein